MVASNIASVNCSRRGDIARDGFDRDISFNTSDRSLKLMPAGSAAVIDIWGDTAPSKPTSPAANDDIKTHDVLLSGNAGFVTSPLSFVESLLAEGEIEQQSRIIAKKLESVGWNPYLKTQNQVVLIGTVTGAIREVASNYRNCNIIPTVAKRNRAELLSEFRLYLSENRAARRYSRYVVVSSGPRFPLDDLPEQYKKFSAKIGRFLEQAKDADTFPVEIHLVTIEMTFDKGTVNLHANMVYQPKKAFGAKRWKQFLEFGRKRFKTSFFHDAGRVREPAEIIKYVCKPGEILGLTSEQMAFLATALHNKQLVRPVGGFAAWRKALHVSGQKVRFDREAKKFVRVRRSTREQEIRNDIDETNRTEERAQARREGRIRDDKPAGTDGDRESDPIENQILCTTLPQARSNVLAETYVVVRNYTPEPTTKNGRRGLEALDRRRVHYVNLLARKAVSRDVVERAGSPGSIFNTLTIIPTLTFCDIPRLPEKSKKRLFERLHLPDGASPSDSVQALRTRLQTLLPTRSHQWSDDVADVAKLFDAGVARQDAFRVEQERARKAKRQLLESGWEDEQIPLWSRTKSRYEPKPDGHLSAAAVFRILGKLHGVANVRVKTTAAAA